MNETPIPERVTALEANQHNLEMLVGKVETKQESLISVVNTVHLNVSSIKIVLDELVKRSSIWRDPFLYASLVSAFAALAVVYK